MKQNDLLWIFLLALVLLVFPCYGQERREFDTGGFSVGLYGGAGVTNSSLQTKGSMQFGANFNAVMPNHGIGFVLESGFVGPWSDPGAGAALFSVNYQPTWQFPAPWKKQATIFPFATVGYSRLFGTGNAINFGAGFDYAYADWRAIRIEVRDYDAFTSPQQHNVALRVGWIIYWND